MTRTLPKHIFKRGNSYAVRFNVTTEARSFVGKKEIVRGLGTSDLGEALSKRDEVLREIRDSLYEKPKDAPMAPERNSLGTTVGTTSARWLLEPSQGRLPDVTKLKVSGRSGTLQRN